jgi:hypothetical protein
MTEPKTTLSASRIKTAQSCSWLYWSKYVLKLPDTSNDGASRGWICHLIFEVLGDERRRKTYQTIIDNQDIFVVPSIKRLVLKHAKKLGVDDVDNIEMIKEMTFNGLSYDFFGNAKGKPTESLSEQDFEIIENNGEICYKIKGFIDKLFLYKKQKFALIRDFKSSKAVFAGKEAIDNMQDLMYSLAVKHLFPEYENRESEFLFIKFDLDEKAKDSGLLRMKAISPEELYGFELQLTGIQKYLDNFTEKDALNNLAANKGYPTDKSFSGKLMCGFAKEKGELKKDGAKKWSCSMKFDFFYYHIFDKEKRFFKTVMEDDFSENLIPDGGSYEMKYYAGCPSELKWKK